MEKLLFISLMAFAYRCTFKSFPHILCVLLTIVAYCVKCYTGNRVIRLWLCVHSRIVGKKITKGNERKTLARRQFQCIWKILISRHRRFFKRKAFLHFVSPSVWIMVMTDKKKRKAHYIHCNLVLSHPLCRIWIAFAFTLHKAILESEI